MSVTFAANTVKFDPFICDYRLYCRELATIVMRAEFEEFYKLLAQQNWYEENELNVIQNQYIITKKLSLYHYQLFLSNF